MRTNVRLHRSEPFLKTFIRTFTAVFVVAQVARLSTAWFAGETLTRVVQGEGRRTPPTEYDEGICACSDAFC